MKEFDVLKYGKIESLHNGNIVRWTDNKTKEVLDFVRRTQSKKTTTQFLNECLDLLDRIYRGKLEKKDNSIKTKKRMVRQEISTFALHCIPTKQIYSNILDICQSHGIRQSEINKDNKYWIGKEWLQFFKQHGIKLYH